MSLARSTNDNKKREEDEKSGRLSCRVWMPTFTVSTARHASHMPTRPRWRIVQNANGKTGKEEGSGSSKTEEETPLKSNFLLKLIIINF